MRPVQKHQPRHRLKHRGHGTGFAFADSFLTAEFLLFAALNYFRKAFVKPGQAPTAFGVGLGALLF
jgi:hypothetical protein